MRGIERRLRDSGARITTRECLARTPLGHAQFADISLQRDVITSIEFCRGAKIPRLFESFLGLLHSTSAQVCEAEPAQGINGGSRVGAHRFHFGRHCVLEVWDRLVGPRCAHQRHPELVRQ